MELQEPGEYHETPQAHELSGIRRGHFARLKMDNSFFWVQVKNIHFGRIVGTIESTYPGGPERGDEIIFFRKDVYEIN